MEGGNVLAFTKQNVLTPELREVMLQEARDFDAQVQLVADEFGRIVDYVDSYVTKAPPSMGGAAAHVVYYLPFYSSKVRVRITKNDGFWLEVFLIISNAYDNENSVCLMSTKDKKRVAEFLVAGAGDWR